MIPRHGCPSCPHLPHPGKPCRFQTVTGPPCAGGKPVGAGYDHGTRTVTKCDCTALTLVEVAADA